jgi:glycosyltransferase involved in cell wall biosynthesis
MRIGILFHKDPLGPPTGIDLVRLRAITGGLIRSGLDTEVVAPVTKEGLIERVIRVHPLAVLDQAGSYDLVKTCYHHSIRLLGRYQGPVVSRIVRVVDRQFPERDEAFREDLLRCQDMIRDRASTLVLNNWENASRWRSLYGATPPITLVPTGCPREIPVSRGTPFETSKRVILFLGSVAAPRMVGMLNTAANRLSEVARVHLVGLNKACMYGGDESCRLDPLIVDHGELPEDQVWDYVRHAAAGLALATGPHAFDNDVSKILTYLRGGLPVLSEEPIVNNNLVIQTGFGRTFRYDDANDLVRAAIDLFQAPLAELREGAMSLLAREHSWDRRVETYVDLFRRIAAGGQEL